MIGLIAAALGLATEIFKHINTDQARKYLDRAVELQLLIQGEEARGYDSDDAKIEAYYAELGVIVDAAQKEFQLYAQKGASSPHA